MGEEKDLQIDVVVKHNLTYAWQMETVEGEVLDQYSQGGKENSWKTLDTEKIVRASLISRNPFLPSHDILIDLPAGEKFIKRFGRGFIQPYTGKLVRQLHYDKPLQGMDFWLNRKSDDNPERLRTLY